MKSFLAAAMLTVLSQVVSGQVRIRTRTGKAVSNILNAQLRFSQPGAQQIPGIEDGRDSLSAGRGKQPWHIPAAGQSADESDGLGGAAE